MVSVLKWLKEKLRGCYGYDQLSITLLLIGFIISIISYLVGVQFLVIISYLIMILVLFRVFSKNTKQRGLENYKFMILVSPIYSFYNKLKNNRKLKKTSKIITCSKCQQKMKVPKNRGKITVTCPKCGNKIDTKS